MVNTRFFNKPKAHSLQEVKLLTGARVYNGEILQPDQVAERLFQDVKPLDLAGKDDISFFDNRKYLEAFKATKAGICFVKEDVTEHGPKECLLLVVKDPYLAFAHTCQAFYGEDGSLTVEEPSIDKTALIDTTAKIGKHVHIEPYVVIEAGVEIGDYCKIGASTIIKQGVIIGEKSSIGPLVVISHSIIGKNVLIHAGAKIGNRGFGFAMGPAGFVKMPQLGLVIIEDDVEIGANTTIDRGSMQDTVIGRGTMIDNLVQLGHNVKTGQQCVLVAQVGIAGSTVLGNGVMAAGQVGIAGHLHIGDGAKLAAQSGIIRDIDSGEAVMGTPALPLKQFFRQVSFIKKMVQNRGT